MAVLKSDPVQEMCVGVGVRVCVCVTRISGSVCIWRGVCGGGGVIALTTSAASRGGVDVESNEVRCPGVGLPEAAFLCATPTPKSEVMQET